MFAILKYLYRLRWTWNGINPYIILIVSIERQDPDYFKLWFDIWLKNFTTQTLYYIKPKGNNMNDKVTNDQMAKAQELVAKPTDGVDAEPKKPAVVQTEKDVPAEALV